METKRFFSGKKGSAKEQATNHLTELGFEKEHQKYAGSVDNTEKYNHPKTGMQAGVTHHKFGMSVVDIGKDINKLPESFSDHIKISMLSLMEEFSYDEEAKFRSAYWKLTNTTNPMITASSGNKPDVYRHPDHPDHVFVSHNGFTAAFDNDAKHVGNVFYKKNPDSIRMTPIIQRKEK